MRIVDTNELREFTWSSPDGTFAGAGKQVSEALGRDAGSTDALARHPFDVEILRVAPGGVPHVYHLHGAQWEFYHVVSGTGYVRHADGTTRVRAGSAVLFKPGEAHQLVNDGDMDLVAFVVADNPLFDSCYYPDTKQWSVRYPEHAFIRGVPVDHFADERSPLAAAPRSVETAEE